MAAVAAAAGSLAVASVSTPSRSPCSSSSRCAARPSLAGGVRRLSIHGGLKAQNDVMAIGLGVSTEQQFADLRAQCSARSTGLSKGGAASSTCDISAEIFPLIPIMSGLVLIGIAVGFVLLRVEAAIEDAE